MTTHKHAPGSSGVSLRDAFKYMRYCISDRDIEAIQRKAVEMAQAGNLAAARLCLSFHRAQRRAEPVKIDLPPLHTTDDVLAAVKIVANDVAAGKLTATEAGNLARMLQLLLQAMGYLDLEKRVRAIEDQG